MITYIESFHTFLLICDHTIGLIFISTFFKDSVEFFQRYHDTVLPLFCPGRYSPFKFES